MPQRFSCSIAAFVILLAVVRRVASPPNITAVMSLLKRLLLMLYTNKKPCGNAIIIEYVRFKIGGVYEIP